MCKHLKLKPRGQQQQQDGRSKWEIALGPSGRSFWPLAVLIIAYLHFASFYLGHFAKVYFDTRKGSSSSNVQQPGKPLNYSFDEPMQELPWPTARIPVWREQEPPSNRITRNRLILTENNHSRDEKATTTAQKIYPEALVHPAMMAHPNPRRVAVQGNGAILREVLKHKSVDQVVWFPTTSSCEDSSQWYSETTSIQCVGQTDNALTWFAHNNEQDPFDVVILDDRRYAS